MTSAKRFAVRREVWGGLALDLERDRIWGFDQEKFEEFNENSNLVDAKVDGRDPFCYDGPSFFGTFPAKVKFSLRAPISVSWTVTLRCQSACIFCCTNSHSNGAWGADISTIKKALDNLSNWGALRLIAGGGEPLLRPDIEEILAYASEQGLAPALATNGFLLSADMAKCLAPHVMQFQISLDSVRTDEYAALRGTAGGPHLAIEAIEHAAATGRCVRIVTVLNSRNIEFLDEIAEVVNNSSAAQWFIFVVQPSGRGARMFHKLRLDDTDSARMRIGEIKKYLRTDLAVCFWGDQEQDGIAVYLTEDCNLILKDYKCNTSTFLDNANSLNEPGGFITAWKKLAADAKYATLKNFVSPNRTL
ncbi:radical SAM protein [Lentilitoribacter sp. EG35]|uniref:radical SAM protein n=1 Tax=Lentilitoribacter sp. EG35 TaxID=3234192 RepID=UPI003460F9B5